MIIDAHSHLGKCRIYGNEVTEENLINTMDKNEVRSAIVQPFPGVSDATAVHNQIAELTQKHPGRIFGMVSLNPYININTYRAETLRCIRELGFVAIKLHPAAHAVSPLSDTAMMVFELANELDIPIMVHTGAGTPFALPALCIPAARQYPNLRIILAHAGFAIYTPEAYVVAKECENVFLETSWCLGEDIAWLVNSIGAERVMIGSDLPSNLPVEITKYRTLDLENDQLKQCLYYTAKYVFKLKI